MPTLIYGGDQCPRCGLTLDYEETADGEEIWLIHPNPQCGWIPVKYPERITLDIPPGTNDA